MRLVPDPCARTAEFETMHARVQLQPAARQVAVEEQQPYREYVQEAAPDSAIYVTTQATVRVRDIAKMSRDKQSFIAK